MGGRFYNPYEKRLRRGFSHFLLWRFGYYNDPYPHEPPPEDFIYPNPDEQIDETAPCVTWINHSSFWIYAHGKSVLVDPIWQDRCSPFPFIGPKRQHEGLPPCEAIEHLDFIIITHNHYDHFDKKTALYLQKKFPNVIWIVPTNVRQPFMKHVVELAWWESHDFGGMRVTAVPAQHFSGRGIFDRNTSLWMGVVVEFEEGGCFYCSGDTGYNEHDFKQIGQEFDSFDLSLIPIGIYSPREFMRTVHINPDEAVTIHQEVGSKLSIGGHWGTFRLASETMNRPPYDLYRALEAKNLCPSTFRVLDPGQTINWWI